MNQIKKIYYIAYYDELENEKCRNVSPAAVNKIDYISQTLVDLGYVVQIVSPAIPNEKSKYISENREIKNNIFLHLFKSKYSKNKLTRIFLRLLHRIRFIHYIRKIPKNSTILLYHSLSLMRVASYLNKRKKYNFIFEVEEIYGDVIKKAKVSAKEIKLISKSSKYIFPTEVLDEKLNIQQKINAIIYGIYHYNDNITHKFDDGRIHCVYSGTLSKDKGGAIAAAAGLYLDEKYCIHILGFGSANDKTEFIRSVAEINEKTKCEIIYEGTLFGSAFDNFLQKCHIGLSTQTSEQLFSNTSFPSKILTYMSNDLHVVSGKIEPVMKSYIGKHITFYEGNASINVAEAIKSIDIFTKVDNKKIINDLDEMFKNQLIKLI